MTIPSIFPYCHLLKLYALVSSVRYDVLFLEYQYVRIYIYSLTMQAIDTRRKAQLSSTVVAQSDVHPQDQTFIHQVLEGCKTILEMTLKYSGLGHLKYFPTRVHIEIASSAVHLIKVCLSVPIMQRLCEVGVSRQLTLLGTCTTYTLMNSISRFSF